MIGRCAYVGSYGSPFTAYMNRQKFKGSKVVNSLEIVILPDAFDATRLQRSTPLPLDVFLYGGLYASRNSYAYV